MVPIELWDKSIILEDHKLTNPKQRSHVKTTDLDIYDFQVNQPIFDYRRPTLDLPVIQFIFDTNVTYT